jgi:hypothetical protein
MLNDADANDLDGGGDRRITFAITTISTRL